MKKKVLSLLGVVALAIGVAVFVAPSASHAVTITTVSVTVGSTTWCQVGGACPAANQIWALGAGVALPNPGDALILAQTNGFNFDTSEGNVPTACGTPTPCSTSITINGVNVFTSPSSVLANFNADPGGNAYNEAANYPAGPNGGVANSYNLFLGYADNVHTAVCADTDANCQPDPFAAGPFAVGTGVPAGIVETNPNHCTATAANCFDSGVLRIVAVPGETKVPEASTLLLLGTGLMGVAAWSRRRLQGKN